MKELPPLRVFGMPAGWVSKWNELRQIDPENLPAGDSDWELLGQDLVHLEHTATGLALHVGWYPEASPQGTFKLEVILATDWDHPFLTFYTRSLRDLSAHIEEVLISPPPTPPLRVKPTPTIADLAAALDRGSDFREGLRIVALLSNHYGAGAIPVQ